LKFETHLIRSPRRQDRYLVRQSAYVICRLYVARHRRLPL